MEISLSGLPPKIQANVDQWNLRWRSIEDEGEKIETMRTEILDSIENVAPQEVLAKSQALEARVLGNHQRKAAALRERSAILSSCHPAQVDTVSDLESAVAKAEKTAEAGLKKAGINPENDPHFDANPDAANNRFRLRVRECGPVRAAMSELQDAKGLLERVAETRHQDKLILQSGIDELNTVARKLLRM
jgi:hypothetical protein